MPHDMIKELDDVLTQEKADLLAGNYDALPALERRKEQALKGLGNRNTSKKALAHIQHRISENQALLTAAIRGIRTAQGRIQDLQKVQNSLTVYDHSGNMEVVTTRSAAFEKKA